MQRLYHVGAYLLVAGITARAGWLTVYGLRHPESWANAPENHPVIGIVVLLMCLVMLAVLIVMEFKTWKRQ